MLRNFFISFQTSSSNSTQQFRPKQETLFSNFQHCSQPVMPLKCNWKKSMKIRCFCSIATALKKVKVFLSSPLCYCLGWGEMLCESRGDAKIAITKTIRPCKCPMRFDKKRRSWAELGNENAFCINPVVHRDQSRHQLASHESSVLLVAHAARKK